MSEDETLVQVEIHGRPYTLRGEGDAAFVRELASYVDERMREIAAQTTTVDTTRVAILAALNITAELFGAKHARGGTPAPAGDRAARRRDERLCRLLDTVLDDESAA